MRRPRPDENSVARPRPRAGTSTRNATTAEVPATGSVGIGASSSPPTRRGRVARRRAVRSCSFRRPGELNESRSFASPPHGRFAFFVPNARWTEGMPPSKGLWTYLHGSCARELCSRCARATCEERGACARSVVATRREAGVALTAGRYADRRFRAARALGKGHPRVRRNAARLLGNEPPVMRELTPPLSASK